MQRGRHTHSSIPLDARIHCCLRDPTKYLTRGPVKQNRRFPLDSVSTPSTAGPHISFHPNVDFVIRLVPCRACFRVPAYVYYHYHHSFPYRDWVVNIVDAAAAHNAPDTSSLALLQYESAVSSGSPNSIVILAQLGRKAKSHLENQKHTVSPSTSYFDSRRKHDSHLSNSLGAVFTCFPSFRFRCCRILLAYVR